MVGNIPFAGFELLTIKKELILKSRTLKDSTTRYENTVSFKKLTVFLIFSFLVRHVVL